ncbi:MAG: DNA primase [Verrucomicrobia bacterium]|nr:DNA primase [Verrucomicrobiota bacterium]
MALVSQSTLEQIRAANDIVDIIGAHVPLKRNGANFVCLCPFHKEKSPSFNVNPSRQIFRCFGCGKGGDVFTFVKEYENLDFMDAVRRLAERARIPLEMDNDPAVRDQRSIKDQLLKLHEAITQRWQQCLAGEAAGQVAREYLERRGVHPDAIREFRVGAAPEAWDDTVNWAKAKGFSPELCETAGLILRRDSGGWYDRFRGRLIFPICDEQGRVIAFSGRVLQGDEKQAKYVNSPETPIFSKGRVLFALDKAKRPILDAGKAILAEGQLDTIACHAAGIRNVVAPQGTAFTADQARVLKRYVDEVVLCFDGDKAGRDAVIRALDPLLAAGLAIRVASIPPPDDPDSWIRAHGAESFQALLNRAQGIFDFYLQGLCSGNDIASDRGRLVVLRSMGEAVHKTANAVLIDTYAQRTAQRLGVDVQSVRAEFRKQAAAAQPRYERSEEDQPLEELASQARPERPGVNELWLLKYVFLSSDLQNFAAVHLEPEWVPNPVVQRILAMHFQEGGDVVGLLGRFEGDPSAESLITEAATEQREIPEPERQLADVVRRLRDAWLDRQIALRNGRLGDPTLDDEDRMVLLSELQALRLRKRSPLEPIP